MDIFHKVALQGLKKSRARTFVTVIGVALSAALVTAVTTFAVSLLSYMVDGAIVKYGGWHVAFEDADSSFVQEAAGDDRVEHISAFENIGYAMLEGGENPDKPYLFVAGFSREAFDDIPVNLLSGRLPENCSEILVPAHVASNGGVRISVGDTLTLAVGSRQDGNETLGQHDPYRPGEEALLPAGEKTFTVVGICQRPAFEERTAPGYTLITLEDNKAWTGSFGVFVTLKKARQVRSYAEGADESRRYIFNDEVLRFMGISDNNIFNALLYSVGGVVIALVMLGSVFLIYNSFNISLNERTHQFGILLSVGATERQLINSVLFEGLCIGAAGIPIGILIGIPSIKLVLFLVEQNFANVLYDNVPLALKVSAPALAAAVAVSMVTILISAYIPAKKAARTPVMECIRQTNEIKVEGKAVKTPKFVGRIYGLEGALALKNFKRNKRRYRSIILSLTLSVVLFVSASSFVMDLDKISEQSQEVISYDIGLGAQDMDDGELIKLYDKLKNTEYVTESSYQAVLEYSCVALAGDLSDNYWKAIGKQPTGQAEEIAAEIQFLDDAAYLKIIDDLALPAEEYTSDTKLIAVAKMEDDTGRAETVGELPDLFAGSAVSVSIIPKQSGEPAMEQEKGIEITCVETVPPDTPPHTGTYQKTSYFFRILAPWSLKEELAPSGAAVDTKVKGLTFWSDKPAQATARMQKIIDGENVTAGYTLYNVYAMLEQNRNITFIVRLFAAIFVVMISLIAVANVFNTISTNIKLRRKELAMLRSVGMSDRDFNKMMRFECALYGFRTMLFALPISAVLSWLIYKGMMMGGDVVIDFIFPWESLGISILGVFLAIFITMLYATHKIKQENIIDALRDELA